MSERELLESLSVDQIVDHILNLGNKVSELESAMNAASEFLEDTYGVLVEDVISSSDCTLLSIKGELDEQ